MLVHSGFANWTYGKDPKQSPTRDDVLDNFTLYWLTNTAASSARIYWENRGQPRNGHGPGSAHPRRGPSAKPWVPAGTVGFQGVPAENRQEEIDKK
jgi:hypothetical protein